MERIKKSKVVEQIDEQVVATPKKATITVKEKEDVLVPVLKKEIEEEVEVTTKLLWKKIGGGSLRWKNQIIKPNQEFWADPSELPRTFLPYLKCLEATKFEEIKSKRILEKTTPEGLYTLVEKKKGLWAVVGASGKAINETLLSKEAAIELSNNLNT